MDASAMLDRLLRTSAGLRVEQLLETSRSDIHVPDLCGPEVVSGLRRMLLEGQLTAQRAQEAIEDYVGLAPTAHQSRPFLMRSFRLRDNFSTYDAMYVALAEILEAPLVTTDAPLARATVQHTELTVLPAAAHRGP
jgi:predicted nucleic acid-binding protein